MRRRDLLWQGLGATGGAAWPAAPAAPSAPRARVIVVKTEDRADGIRRALRQFGGSGIAGRRVVVKPNFNSAHPFPGSTHADTLGGLVEWLGGSGAREVTVADRSGMGRTREVIEAKGVAALGRRLGFRSVALDEEPARAWVARPLPGSHWARGALFPRLLEEAEAIVATCCLKTHRFGGHVTLSLKNSVGAVAKYGADGYDYMSELHRSPAQREMIAELNLLYRPTLVLLDGMEAFVRGGPEAGATVAPGVILAGEDRVAIDAVGVALLRMHATTPEVAAGPIFAQAQLRRAAALGVGVDRPDRIELVTDDAASAAAAAEIRRRLEEG